ncbi:MAG: acyl carrier protein [Trebonia sp.]
MSISLAELRIGEWLASYVGELIARPASEIDQDVTFDSFGIDSANVIGITGELQTWLGVSIDPEAAYEYPTIRLLAGYLAERVTGLPGGGSEASDSPQDS